MNLYTFGYEGLTIDDFIRTIRRAKVQLILDVRELPLSRKPGFSKSPLAAALADAAIGYSHLPVLGCPRPIRDRYRADGDWSAYVTAFSGYLAEQSDAVAEVARTALRTTTCLICFEADFDRCHRSMVARAAAAAGGPPVAHLTVKGEVPEAARLAVA